MSSFSKLPAEARYAILISRLNDEHTLSTSRMSWLLTFQGLLFTAVAFAGDSNQLLIPRVFFEIIVPTIGGLSALAVFGGLIGSRLARRQLKIMAMHLEKDGFPRMSPSPRGALLGALPLFVVPTLLFLAWSFVVIAPKTIGFGTTQAPARPTIATVPAK